VFLCREYLCPDSRFGVHTLSVQTVSLCYSGRSIVSSALMSTQRACHIDLLVTQRPDCGITRQNPHGHDRDKHGHHPRLSGQPPTANKHALTHRRPNQHPYPRLSFTALSERHTRCDCPELSEPTELVSFQYTTTETKSFFLHLSVRIDAFILFD
jgi:hypothetical protein